MTNIGFLGLGTMGFPMCYGLYKKGWHMVLPTYRKTRDQSVRFIPMVPDEKSKTAAYDEMLSGGCEGAKSQTELFEKSDEILLSLPTSREVEAVVFGADGILENARPGTLVIDFTSADAASSRRICAALAARQIDFLDAPVSGGQAGATDQTLSVMVGGSEEAFEKAKPILHTVGKPEKVTYLGPSGSGDAVKCANNFLSCACFLATAEALTALDKAGIDPHIAAKVIGESGGSSNAVLYKFPKLMFSGQGMNMPVDLMKKDVALFVALAKDQKVPSVYGSTALEQFEMRSGAGRGDEDFSCVARLYEDWSGAKLWDID